MTDSNDALAVLADLSSYVGAGMGDDNTTAEQYDKRIRWGIDHIGSAYRNRAAQVVEECSKRPGTTWGNVKRAILDDTALPTASGEVGPISSPDAMDWGDLHRLQHQQKPLVAPKLGGPIIRWAVDEIEALRAALAA